MCGGSWRGRPVACRDGQPSPQRAPAGGGARRGTRWRTCRAPRFHGAGRRVAHCRWTKRQRDRPATAGVASSLRAPLRRRTAPATPTLRGPRCDPTANCCGDPPERRPPIQSGKTRGRTTGPTRPAVVVSVSRGVRGCHEHQRRGICGCGGLLIFFRVGLWGLQDQGGATLQPRKLSLHQIALFWGCPISRSS